MQVMQFQRADRRSKGRSIKCRHHARGTDFSQGVMYILVRAACDNTHVCVVLIFKTSGGFKQVCVNFLTCDRLQHGCL